MEYRRGRLSAAFAAVVLIALPALGQTAKAPPATHNFTPPHTSWGDPDLQGWFTNENEDGTPLERPSISTWCPASAAGNWGDIAGGRRHKRH